MEGLKILIRNLAFILLLATFLEMLLPNKSMKGFVQLIMGLFVIAAVLSPLADFLKLEISSEIPAWASVSAGELPVLAPEGKSEDAGKTAVREQYKNILISQVNSLISASEDLADLEVRIELEDNGKGMSDYPDILKIEIVFEQAGIKPVKPVIVGQAEEEETVVEETAKARNFKKQIASFLQIPEEKIVVLEKS